MYRGPAYHVRLKMEEIMKLSKKAKTAKNILNCDTRFKKIFTATEAKYQYHVQIMK